MLGFRCEEREALSEEDFDLVFHQCSLVTYANHWSCRTNEAAGRGFDRQYLVCGEPARSAWSCRLVRHQRGSRCDDVHLLLIGKLGNRVNSICPGLIATAIWEGDRNNVPGLIERMENNIAPKEMGVRRRHRRCGPVLRLRCIALRDRRGYRG